MRVVGVVIETGIIETEPNGRWFRLLEDHTRYSGLLTLRACDLAVLLRRGSMTVRCFRAGEQSYGDIAEPEDGIEVRVEDETVWLTQNMAGDAAVTAEVARRISDLRSGADRHGWKPF